MGNKAILTFMGVLIVAVFILFVPAFTVADEGKPNILFIFDSSGSMMNPIADKEPKLVAAKRVLSELVGENLAGANVGLMAYGHREKSGCDDIETLVPIGKLNVDEIKQNIASLEAKGNTPIASALEKGANELQGLKGKSTIVLISDGEETCGGDPIRAAEIIRKRLGINVVIQVIGFDVDDKAKQQLAGIAQAGGGKYYAARDAEQLKNSLIEIKKEAVVVKEPEPDVYFFDDFDGEDLAEHWEVLNPDPDSFIVDNGVLSVVVASHEPLQGSDKLSNIFRLTKPLPKGDWTVTMRLKPEVSTFRENYILGIYSDKDKMLTATTRIRVGGVGNVITSILGDKLSKGKNTGFSVPALRSPGIGNFPAAIKNYTDWTKKNLQAILLRIEKSGRAYTISTKIEGEATMAGGKKPEWVKIQKLTSLRPPGDSLVIAFNQMKFTNGGYQVPGGESLTAVDWIKIEIPANENRANISLTRFRG